MGIASGGLVPKGVMLAGQNATVMRGTGTSAEKVWPTGPVILDFDDFNRTTLGGNYIVRGTAPVIRGNALSAPSQGSNTAMRKGNCSYRIPMPVDDYRVTVKLSTPAYVDQHSGIQISSDLLNNGGDPTSYIGLGFGSNSQLIFTRINGIYNNRATSSTAIAQNDLISFERKSNVITAYKNGVAFLTWNGNGHGLPSGAGQRYIGFGMSAQYPRFQSLYYSPNFDEFHVYPA